VSETEQPMVDVTLTVAVSEADGYGGAHAAGETISVPADVAERLIAAGIAAAPGTTTEEPAAEHSSGAGATGRRRTT